MIFLCYNYYRGGNMLYLGSKQIETERLILKAQTMEEQKRLWEILMLPEVRKYYLTVPVKFREKLLDWTIQEEFFRADMERANDLDVFRWSVFLKENGECIGKVSCHKASAEDSTCDDPSIMGVGWIMDPAYQGCGYATEAAKAMIDFMFREVEVKEICTGAATQNFASWKIMEKLGFIRQDKTNMVQYTYLDEPVEDYSYILTREEYLNKEKEGQIRK